MQRRGVFFLQRQKIPKQQEKVNTLKKKTQTILFKTRSVFPFDFFPDTLLIDSIKVTFILQKFFYSQEVTSLYISDIENVVVQTGPFFAKLSVISRYVAQRPIKIAFLWKKQAIKAHNILQGLIIANKQDIDMTTDNLEDAEAFGEFTHNEA
jgi:hypothetical protein